MGSLSTPGVRTQLRALLRPPWIFVVLVSLGVGVWGILLSFSASDENGPGMWVRMLPAAVLCGLMALVPVFWPTITMRTFRSRILISYFIAPVVVAVPVGIVQAILYALPAARDTIAAEAIANGGRHEIWDDGLALNSMNAILGGIIFGMLAALGVSLFITFPVLSFRAPAVLAAGTTIEKRYPRLLNRSIQFIFCGLGVLMLGLALWSFFAGDIDFTDAIFRISVLARWGWNLRDGLVVLGALCTIVGGLSVVWGVLRTKLLEPKSGS